MHAWHSSLTHQGKSTSVGSHKWAQISECEGHKSHISSPPAVWPVSRAPCEEREALLWQPPPRPGEVQQEPWKNRAAELERHTPVWGGPLLLKNMKICSCGGHSQGQPVLSRAVNKETGPPPHTLIGLGTACFSR